MGINFFFTFPTSEGSDLLSSHVMQTPTFISKLSDGNVIFRLDVEKNIISNTNIFLILRVIGLTFFNIFFFNNNNNNNFIPTDNICLQYVPGLSLQEGFFFLILRKNFRGITFFVSSETPISVIKKSFQHRGRLNIKIKDNVEKIFSFFLKKSNDR
jgi:hypothetical protein